jgi:hypothetical protein
VLIYILIWCEIWKYVLVIKKKSARIKNRIWLIFGLSIKGKLPKQIIIPPLPEGGGRFILFYLCPSVLPSLQDIFRQIFLSNYWWQKSDIWSQASYRYTILWVAFLDPSDFYFLFADLVGFYTHWTYMYMHIFRHIFLSNYWWHRSDIWSQASYRYPISWETFLDPSDSYFLFADCWFLYTLNIHFVYVHF